MAGERLQKALKRYRERYAPAGDTKQKGEILNEFLDLSGYHRKYALSLLQPGREVTEPDVRRHCGATYSSEALGVIEGFWRAAGYPWSVRLKGMLPIWLPWAKKQRGGISPEVERRVLSISPRQIDRPLMGKERKVKWHLRDRMCQMHLVKSGVEPPRRIPGSRRAGGARSLCEYERLRILWGNAWSILGLEPLCQEVNY